MKQKPMIMTTRTTPSRAILLSRNDWTISTHGRDVSAISPAAGPGSPAAGPGSIVSVIAHPRVEDGVHNVGEQVAEHGDQADDNGDAELDRVVRGRRGSEKRQPDPLHVEHVLGDHAS